MHLIEVLASLVSILLPLLAIVPLGFLLGASCSPCCCPCPADNKPCTAPASEGSWSPTGTWRGVGGVTWAFSSGTGSGTWFFYGSASTSKVGGNASLEEQQDWGNICNWYSNKTTSPSTTSGLPAAFDKRATTLPPSNAIVHIYTAVSTVAVGPRTVGNAFFWRAGFAQPEALLAGSQLTTTSAAHNSSGGAVFNLQSTNLGVVNGGATYNGDSVNLGVTSNGATFNQFGLNVDTLNGTGVFFDLSRNIGTVNGNASFNQSSGIGGNGVVNGNAVFNNDSGNSGVINGFAGFNSISQNFGNVNGSAAFDSRSINQATGTVSNGATFGGFAENFGTVDGGATFRNRSINRISGTVNGGAIFRDQSASQRVVGDFFAVPCTRKFVAHPTDLPTCVPAPGFFRAQGCDSAGGLPLSNIGCG